METELEFLLLGKFQCLNWNQASKCLLVFRGFSLRHKFLKETFKTQQSTQQEAIL